MHEPRGKIIPVECGQWSWVITRNGKTIMQGEVFDSQAEALRNMRDTWDQLVLSAIENTTGNEHEE